MEPEFFAERLPAGASGHSPAGCRFGQDAATRVFATSAADHSLCSIGQYIHNLDMNPASGVDLQAALIPVLASKASDVIYGPLAEIPLHPDVVLLFVRADQTLVLSEASQQLENGLPPAPQFRPIGAQPRLLGRACLDVLSPEVALYAIPGKTLEAFAGRIAALSKVNEILMKFHQIRRKDIEAGLTPSIQESLLALQSAG